MPPKSKLHKATGKAKSLPPSIQTESNENNTETYLSPEAVQQFELELCWCIQQLNTALKSGKLNPKQVQDHTKTLNILMSNSTQLVKKRQVMRLSFGDYRAKMAAEDKRLHTANCKIKISHANPSKKSMFLKRSMFVAKPEGNVANEIGNIKIDNGIDQIQIIDGFNKGFHFKPTNDDFTFNFSNSENNAEDNIGDVSIEAKEAVKNVDTTNNFHFKPTSNNFKFNFEITE